MHPPSQNFRYACLDGKFLSCKKSNASRRLSHPPPILCVTSSSISSFPYIIDPSYLKGLNLKSAQLEQPRALSKPWLLTYDMHE